MNLKEVFADIYKSIIANKSFLVLLVITDFMFLILHTLYVHNMIDGNPYCSLELDLGYSEFYQYMKEFWIFILFLFIAQKKKYLIYLVWALFFFYLLLDDSLAFHENYGKYLKDYFEIQPRFNLRPQDFGEILVSFSVGFVFLILFIFSYLKIDLEGKKITKNVFVLVLLLVFFGIFIDLLHIAIPYHSNRFTLVEDGGEMFVMSLILCYVFYLNKEVIIK
ncbi:hypothetical protein Q4Q34_17700 [Flavivirga abyssicola]|uniref:hypothetical protein n=1 Tax=Flavivirga abyssicola TaxID=3063533 RepID=UPI0026E0B137|nr:hypothetical protein [Flavivirga sp. MEBiC07777]WVK13052.1 hypothetical protein Q4Q34_17700 [Flavivirga sp. MEBiC07777]